MAAIDYMDVYNGQPTVGLDRSVMQPILGFAYASDGGGPATDGITCYSREWFISHWNNTPAPCTSHSLGTSYDGGRTYGTYKGFVAMTGLAEGASVINQYGFFMSLTDPLGTGPNFAFENDCSGGVTIDPAVFASPPTISGTPGDSQILWTWTPGILLDTRVPIVYAISVSTGTPSSHPVFPVFAGASFLSSGLTNGVTYNARVEAYVGLGGSSGSPMAFSSTRNTSSSRGPAGGDGLSNIASAVPAAVPTASYISLDGLAI